MSAEQGRRYKKINLDDAKDEIVKKFSQGRQYYQNAINCLKTKEVLYSQVVE